MRVSTRATHLAGVSASLFFRGVQPGFLFLLWGALGLRSLPPVILRTHGMLFVPSIYSPGKGYGRVNVGTEVAMSGQFPRGPRLEVDELFHSKLSSSPLMTDTCPWRWGIIGTGRIAEDFVGAISAVPSAYWPVQMISGPSTFWTPTPSFYPPSHLALPPLRYFTLTLLRCI